MVRLGFAVFATIFLGFAMIGSEWDNMGFWESMAYGYSCVGAGAVCGVLGGLGIWDSATTSLYW